MGIFYDLKQTQERKPTGVDPKTYWEVLDEFFAKGWDESILNKYYRISKPLYTTQIFIPSMSADSAPKAFNAPPSVLPSRWIIHYKGQVSPPESGTYRFVGCADDLIAVAVNKKNVLISPWRGTAKAFLKTAWKSPEPDGIAAPFGDHLRNGDWLELKSTEIYDLDILIGERPGGRFDAFLLVERKGGTYTLADGRNPILPIFQIGVYDTPLPKADTAPPFAKGFPIWKSYQ